MDETTAPRMIYVVSDATGHSAERLARAALSQFPDADASVRVWPMVQRAEDIDAIVQRAADTRALVVHTLVDPSHVQHLARRAQALRVDCVDLIGPLLSTLTIFLQKQPRGRPGRSAAMDADYFRRIAALEFTVAADDGRGVDRLHEADIVLVGPSRTSKTPVATYLAGQGYKVANVPLVRNLEPPPELLALARGKVFALTIDPLKLAEIRASRMTQLGVNADGDYADFDHVVEELRWANALFRQHGWPVINVSHLAVEETASQVLRQRGRMLGSPNDGDERA